MKIRKGRDSHSRMKMRGKRRYAFFPFHNYHRSLAGDPAAFPLILNELMGIHPTQAHSHLSFLPSSSVVDEGPSLFLIQSSLFKFRIFYTIDSQWQLSGITSEIYSGCQLTGIMKGMDSSYCENGKEGGGITHSMSLNTLSKEIQRKF